MKANGYLCARRESRRPVALAPELIGRAPLEAPLDGLSFTVLDEDLNPRMRVLELKLFDRSRKLERPVAVEFSAGMMGKNRLHDKKQSEQNQNRRHNITSRAHKIPPN